jgi:gluconate kinase
LSTIKSPVERLVLLLSGPLAVGKTSAASELVARFGFERVRSGAFLQKRAALLGRPGDRVDLQSLGDELDESTDFRWLVDEVVNPAFREKPEQRRWLVDAVRKRRQVDHFRQAFEKSVVHLYLSAPEPTLKARYEARIRAGEEYVGTTPYEIAIQHPNEVAARALQGVADLLVNIEGKTTSEVSAEIARLLDLHG